MYDALKRYIEKYAEEILSDVDFELVKKMLKNLKRKSKNLLTQKIC